MMTAAIAAKLVASAAALALMVWGHREGGKRS